MRAETKFYDKAGHEVPSKLWINPDGSPGPLVPVTATIDQSATIHASAIIAADANIGPREVIGAYMIVGGEHRERLVPRV